MKRKLFENVRTVESNGELWFSAEDVCKELEYDNHLEAIAKFVDEEDKALTDLQTDTGEKEEEVMVINEAALYTLILKSQSEDFKWFSMWVAHEAIPLMKQFLNFQEKEINEKALAEDMKNNNQTMMKGDVA